MFGMNDPFFSMLNGDPFGQNPQQGGQNQQQNQRMNQQMSMRDPFAAHMMMMQGAGSPFGHHNAMMAAHQQSAMSNPFALMNSMMSGLRQQPSGFSHPIMNSNSNVIHADPNSQVFSSSSVMTFSNSGPGGKPKIYQASTQTSVGPNGVKETRKLERDSERGIEKLAVGHHIGERAHIIERQKINGQVEECVNLENLDDNDLPEFNQEFEHKIASTYRPNHSQRSHINHPHHLASRDQPFAIDHDGSSGRKKERKSKPKTSKHTLKE